MTPAGAAATTTATAGPAARTPDLVAARAGRGVRQASAAAPAVRTRAPAVSQADKAAYRALAVAQATPKSLECHAARSASPPAASGQRCPQRRATSFPRLDHVIGETFFDESMGPHAEHHVTVEGGGRF